ncbi:MAG: N-acetylneuraminate synthase family protein, partial [Parcubacteria group bacterium]|nr:N-acetylneuraminate synthase family protein [Parcubacteria group bacterium]
MNPPCYKIASYEAVHIPLIRRVAKTRKPVIISIGFASQEEVELAVKTLRENGCQNITMLHCVTAYSDKPSWENTNLRTIEDIARRFGVVAGFSDNNAGIELPVLAVTVAGASVVEKHLTLDRKLGGPDAQFSVEPDEF